MIDAEPGIVEHAERDRDERGEQHLARGADVIAEQHHHRERDREVIGIALLEAERAWLEAEPYWKNQAPRTVAAPATAIAIAAAATGRARIMLIVTSLMPARRTPKCIPLDLSTISARSFPRKRESKGRVLRPRFVALGPRFRGDERIRAV